MKNSNIYFFFTLLYVLFIYFPSNASEQFNFNVTEVEIKNDGNKFIGKNRGVATTQDGLYIEADEFEYDKILNILVVEGKIVWW